MAEDLAIDTKQSKAEIYQQLLPQLYALTSVESDLVANLGNIAAALHHSLGFFWTGFYMVKKGELVLGPFQGPLACTRIGLGKGVCGTAWQQQQTQLVFDVEEFPGHIACSSASRSEVVVPVLHKGEVVMVLDVDSEKLSYFDETDVQYLEELCRYIGEELVA